MCQNKPYNFFILINLTFNGEDWSGREWRGKERNGKERNGYLKKMKYPELIDFLTYTSDYDIAWNLLDEENTLCALQQIFAQYKNLTGEATFAVQIELN